MDDLTLLNIWAAQTRFSEGGTSSYKEEESIMIKIHFVYLKLSGRNVLISAGLQFIQYCKVS